MELLLKLDRGIYGNIHFKCGRVRLNLNNDGSLLIHRDHSVVVSSSEHLQGRTVPPLQHGYAKAETRHVRLVHVATSR